MTTTDVTGARTMHDRYQPSTEERWVVTAHNLINELAIIAGGVAVLREGWGTLTEERRQRLIGQIESHAHSASDVLVNLARGTLPVEDAIAVVV